MNIGFADVPLISFKSLAPAWVMVGKELSVLSALVTEMISSSNSLPSTVTTTVSEESHLLVAISAAALIGSFGS